MKVLENMCDILEDELKQISKKDNMTPQDLDNAYKAVDIIKDIETIKAMKKSENSYGSYEYSNEYSNRPSYRSYEYSGEYSNEYSRARGSRDGDSDGRYNESRARGGYSRYDDKEQMMQKLEDMKRKIENM